MRFLPRSTPAIALLVVALVVAASGGAMAAKKITGKDIKNNSVTSADIKNGTLAASDFSPGATSSLVGPAGPAGAAGAAGPAGPGFDDFAWYEVVVDDVPANTDDIVAEGDCPEHQLLVSAFAYWNNHNDALQVSHNFIGADTMQAVAWSTGVDDVDTVVLQYACASLPVQAPRPHSSK
ncbi:hypothetical protein [Nocardioides halotolerans]|jgi:hypothetical protein|uniref:hypothetical protein n=1 Tax=Nocardioides halotolerans TaxID=433660 RepID=UPI00042356F3|nr:hypothetical protein [Nocardioides halotolerans]